MRFFSRHLKLEPTLQVAQAECGLCCVRTLLAAHGLNMSLTELRQVKEPGRDGLGIQQLKRLLIFFGMDANVYRVSNTKVLEGINMPVIAFWKGSHFVCIESVERNSAVLMDPSVGRLTISRADLDKDFSGYIVTARPTAELVPSKRSWSKRWTKEYLWPESIGGVYAKVGFTSVVLVLLTLAAPWATKYLIDHGFQGQITLAWVLIVLGIGALIMAGVSYLRTVVAAQLVCRFAWHLSSKAFERLLSLPTRYFNVRAPGEIVYRLNSLNRIQDLLGSALIQGALEMLSAITVLAYIYFLSPLLGIIASALLLMVFFFLGWSQPRISAVTDAELHEGTSAQSIQLDAVVSINSVKLGGYVGTYLKDWQGSFKRLLDAMVRRIRLQDGLIGSLLAATQVFAPIVLLVVSVDLAMRGHLTIGDAVAVQSVASLLFSYARSVFSTWNQVQVAERYVQLAEDIFEYPMEQPGSTRHALSGGQITMVNVEFKYSSEVEPAVSGVTLGVQPGETLALVGKSGSGKTTLGKVMASLFEPTSGTIQFDGLDLSAYDLDHLRSSISYIPQESHLHNRSILENLQLGCDRSEDEIIEFCRKLGFLDFIDEFPMGYHTVVSQLGANLSGGQRQRIQVARVLLQNPKLLIMDEATSSLDNVSQRQVYEQLEALDCTKIVIAHRFATVLNADQIAVLKDGKVIQIGTHNELVSVPGPYSELFHAELEGEVPMPLPRRAADWPVSALPAQFEGVS